MVEYGLALRRDLAREIRRFKPEALAIGGFDLTWPGGFLNQADHRAVGLAACDAARDAGNRWIFPELLAEGLEPWGGVRYVFVSGSHEPTHACDIEDGLEQGIASLVAQHAYFENLGRPFDADAFLRKQAAAAGAAVRGGDSGGVPGAVRLASSELRVGSCEWGFTRHSPLADSQLVARSAAYTSQAGPSRSARRTGPVWRLSVPIARFSLSTK